MKPSRRLESGTRHVLPGALVAAVAALVVAPVPGQGTGTGNGPGVTFSIDYIGPTIAAPDCINGIPITEADILAPCDAALTGTPLYGPLPPPVLYISGGFGPPAPGLGLPLHPGCIGHPPGTVCSIEVDALSYGEDGVLQPVIYDRKGKVYFSVDRCAAGFLGPATFPNVDSEGFLASREAEADAFVSMFLDTNIPPPIIPFPNQGMIDGNGLVSVPTVLPSGASYPGLGLIEPFPFPPPPGPWDNLDALDTEGFLPDPGSFPPTGVYFSLDNAVIDPCTASMGFPPSRSAMPNGPFVGGDVLWTGAPGGPPVVYAPAFLLGLDLFGTDTDDLDALAIRENGIPGWQPSIDPFDWLTGQTDMVLFSVRRGSAIIGTPDSLQGAPIQEGDVLTTPLGGPGVPPVIVIPAEQLGLGTTRVGFPGQFPDDLDALDIRREEPKLFTHGACYGTFGQCPCGNDDPTAGCVNSTGVGGLLLPTAGTSSVANDDLVLTATQLSLNDQGLFYMGDTIVKNPLWDGIQCALGVTWRFLNSIQNTGAAGTMVLGPGIAARAAGLIVPGTTWYFQAWHRDVMPLGPCGTGSNLTNAIGVCFTP